MKVCFGEEITEAAAAVKEKKSRRDLLFASKRPPVNFNLPCCRQLLLFDVMFHLLMLPMEIMQEKAVFVCC